MIVISFADETLHVSCVNLQRAELLLGSIHAKALVTLISDAEAFENVGELIDFLGEHAKILGDDSLTVEVGSDYRAVLVAAGKRFEHDADGRIAWCSVTRLKLIEISRLP